jgi:hypothetical protein
MEAYSMLSSYETRKKRSRRQRIRGNELENSCFPGWGMAHVAVHLLSKHRAQSLICSSTETKQKQTRKQNQNHTRQNHKESR